jgi:hypothetical protein
VNRFEGPLASSGTVYQAWTIEFVEVVSLLILFHPLIDMSSHLDIRAAYRAWCEANPSLRIQEYPHLEEMIEAAELEPVDRVSQP